jgi:DNA replication ATP-dependent helicase Dna2
MSFHKWSGLESDFTHENEQIKILTRVVQRYSEEKNKVIHLLTNFYVGGEEIDATIILPNNVVAIDLKSGNGTIIGSENGDWTCCKLDNSEFTLNKNRSNPYLQVMRKRNKLMGFLIKRREEIFPMQKASQMNFGHTSGCIVFEGKIQWNSDQLPHLPWFDVISIGDIINKIDSIKSNAISLSQEEAWLIPTLLNLRNEDEVIEDNLEKFTKGESGTPDIGDNVTIESEPEDSTSIAQKFNEIPTGNISINDSQLEDQIVDNVISGVFIGIEGSVVKIKTDDLSYRVHLNSHFEAVIIDLKKLANQRAKLINKEEININLVNTKVVENNIYLKEKLNSYFVIEPAWLINVTALAGFDFCGRSLFNNRYSLNSQNEYMMRGSIVHEVFEKVLTDPNDKKGLQKELTDSFKSRGLEFGLLGIDHKEMEDNFIRPHLRALYKYRQDANGSLANITDVNTERFIINPTMGLKGKIDAVVMEGNKHRALELKTGKSWGGNAKPGHAFQVQAYSLLMEMKSKDQEEILNPVVVYSGDSETQYYNSIGRNVSFDYPSKAHIMNLRNKLVLADYLFSIDYEKENPNKCNRCSQAQMCHNLYNLEYTQDANNKPLFINSNIGKDYSHEEKNFFNKYNRLLTEEYRVIKENQGNYLIKKVIDRIKLGKCVDITNYQEFECNVFILSCINSSEFRKMDRCLLSDKLGPVDGECIEATILDVSAKSIRISTRVKLEFIPQYLDLYSSETAFERNYSAIYEIINNDNLKKIKNIMISNDVPAENTAVTLEVANNLHSNQKRAIQFAVGLKDYLLIQGPPGTGKTLTIAHIIDQLYKNNQMVIVSCYTHRAIDEVTRKISKYAPDIPIYRLGATSGNVEDVNSKLLEHKINEHDDVEKRIQVANEIMNSHPVYIGTTHSWLSGRYDNLFKNITYDVAIIDEASQVVIPNALGVIRLAKKFILVGDHMQLPPVIQSEKAIGLSKTLFEILYSNPSTPETVKVMLDIQHRMPKAISEFVSHEFYGGELDVSSEASARYLETTIQGSSYDELYDSKNSMALVNVSSIGSGHSLNKVSVEEAKVIVNIFKDLLDDGILPKQVGIIAPFRAQVAEIRRQIELNLFDYFKSSEEIHSIVDTVDRFQGDERDIIMFSLTLIDENIPDLLSDRRRLNVAISRARMKFIGVGNWDIVSGSDTLRHLKEYVEKSEQCCMLDGVSTNHSVEEVF